MIETRMKKQSIVPLSAGLMTEIAYVQFQVIKKIIERQLVKLKVVLVVKIGTGSEYIADYPDAGLASNYCRNPGGDERAWCFTNFSSLTF